MSSSRNGMFVKNEIVMTKNCSSKHLTCCLEWPNGFEVQSLLLLELNEPQIHIVSKKLSTTFSQFWEGIFIDCNCLLIVVPQEVNSVLW